MATTAALGAVWLLVLLELAPLFRGAIPYDPDVVTQFLPFKAVGAALLREGRAPLWTPLIGLGFPLLAEGQGALLYPPELAVALLGGDLPPATSFSAGVLAHALLAVALMFALLRRWALARPAAFLGALVYGFAGPVLPLAGTPKLTVAAWWPALLIVVDAVTGAADWRTRARWAAAGGACVALLFLGGHPQTAVQGLLLAGLYALYRAIRGRLRRPWAVAVPLGWCAATVALGTALAAPQLLATAELLAQSARAAGAGRLAGQGSLFPPALAQIVAPNWSFAATLGSLSPNLYVGIVPLALAVLAGARRRPDAAFWWAVAVAMAVLACGRFSPLFGIVSGLPVLGLFRGPATFLYVAAFALAVLAAAGLDDLLRAGGRREVVARTLARAGAAALAVWLLVNVGGALAFRVGGAAAISAVAGAAGVSLEGKEARVGHFLDLAVEATSPANSRLIASLVGLAGLGAVALGLRRGVRVAATLAVAATVLDLLVGAPRARLGAPADPPVLERVGAPGGRLYSFGDPFLLAEGGRYDLLPASLNALYGIPGIGLYDPLGDPVYRAFVEPLGAVNLGDMAVPPTLQSLTASRRLLDLLGVSVVLSAEPLSGFTPAGTAGRVHVYRNDAAFPRAWVAAELRAGPADVRDLRDALARGDVDLRRTALIAGGDGALAGVVGEAGPATVLDDAGDAVRLTATGPGVLVLADRWDPHWRARVGGEAAAVLRVNGVLRGVQLPPGEHQVELWYEASGFRRGLVVSGAGALAVLALALASLVGSAPPSPAQRGPAVPDAPGLSAPARGTRRPARG